MDYHLGSGTTAAVAHKMKRQYIGIEQLDYGENDSTIRLQNVINADHRGSQKQSTGKAGDHSLIWNSKNTTKPLLSTLKPPKTASNY